MTETIEVTVEVPGINMVGSPSDGDTIVWNASSGQWEPGAGGGGVSPGTVFEALLPLMPKIVDSVPAWFSNPGIVPADADPVDSEGWITFGFGDEGALDFAFGYGSDGAIYQDFSVYDEANYFEMGFTDASQMIQIGTTDGVTNHVSVRALTGQTAPTFVSRLIGGDSSDIFQVMPTGSFGAFGATPPTQSAAGTTAADAIACLKAFGLMAAL